MTGPPPSEKTTIVAQLAQPGGMKGFLKGRGGENKLTFTPAEITVEHAAKLREPLRFAPGSVVVASVDPGPARVEGGRFPVLHLLAKDRVLPREEGIEGWVWTADGGSAFATLTDEAPNLAFVFSPPLAADKLEAAFPPDELAELAKRSPLGQPALFGLLLRVDKPIEVEAALARYALKGHITDREIPPTQRRHLPDDKPANPATTGAQLGNTRTSMPPPGMS